MRVLIYLGHPAHFHLFKNVISNLQNDGHQVDVLIKKKDILEDLLKNAHIEYHNILEEGRKDSKIGILWGMIKRAERLWKFTKHNRPDILVGTSVENSFIGPLRGIPVINVNEDDADVVPLYAKLSYPGASVILCPEVCSCGKWDKKAMKFTSYHELAYLHPDNFKADINVVKKYISVDKPYIIMRFAKLKAHHDSGIKGIDGEIAKHLIQMLTPSMQVYITSERELEPELEPYRIHINPLDIHHVMAFASLYIGDSQTMAAESGVLGVPFVRFNDFVGRIGYLNELENVYNLGYGVKTSDVDRLYSVVKELVDMEGRDVVYAKRKDRMLSEKIDYAQLLSWFIGNYPESGKMMKEKQGYGERVEKDTGMWEKREMIARRK
jgi:uncharacterized protein